MKIIISPAKKMNIDTDTMEAQGTPFFGTDAREDGFVYSNRLMFKISGKSRFFHKRMNYFMPNTTLFVYL